MIAALLFLTTTLLPCVNAELPLETWIQNESQVAKARMLKNISAEGTTPGTVIASPSRQSPDYFFHWTRDAALVIDQVVELYAQTKKIDQRKALLRKIRDFVFLSRSQQLVASAEGLGEPRFRADGTPDTLPWSRPQYDGPALQALTLIRLLSKLPQVPAPSDEYSVRSVALPLLRLDLDFVAHYWGKSSFDLWEEIRGLHFYTHAVQLAALEAGSTFFLTQGEVALADFFSKAARPLRIELGKYWDPERQILRASREVEGRPGYKVDGLDTAVILAALHTDGAAVSFTDERLLATAAALEAAFVKEYSINQSSNPSSTGTLAMGRFTDDVYFGGNPWYMTTAAFAELHYRVATAIEGQGGITVTPLNAKFLGVPYAHPRISATSPLGQALLAQLRLKGDRFLTTVRKYAGSQGELSEQFDRDAGVPVSASDLTWSYASFLAAIHQRHQ